MKYVLTTAAGISISVLLTIVLVAFFLCSSFVEGDLQNNTEQRRVNFTNSLDIIKGSYTPQVSQSRDFCTGQFKGIWIDNSTDMGCFEMSGFSLDYCSTGAVQQMIDLCNSIGGNPICISNQASCSI